MTGEFDIHNCKEMQEARKTNADFRITHTIRGEGIESKLPLLRIKDGYKKKANIWDYDYWFTIKYCPFCGKNLLGTDERNKILQEAVELGAAIKELNNTRNKVIRAMNAIIEGGK